MSKTAFGLLKPGDEFILHGGYGRKIEEMHHFINGVDYLHNAMVIINPGLNFNCAMRCIGSHEEVELAEKSTLELNQSELRVLREILHTHNITSNDKSHKTTVDNILDRANKLYQDMYF